jgi:OPA family glycerol-3-phosphate transporter-like MFS transporter/OPA family sugar phosphate sensor protein UhpC-like MFS transporter
LTFVGYATYYFVRKNFSAAMPLLEKDPDLDITKSDLGGFLTAHSVLYGISKFANGYFADRANARYFFAFGLIVSALLNLGCGVATTAAVLGVLWCLNGWFQGMGFPPCARVLSHWFAPAERGFKWSIWNSSHMIGGAVIPVWAAWMGKHWGWQWAFLGPALLAIVVSAAIAIFMRDTPGSVGLPPVEEFYEGRPLTARGVKDKAEADARSETPDQSVEQEKPEADPEFREFLKKRVFKNPFIWLICLANFCVYTVRGGFFDWLFSYLTEVKDYGLVESGFMVAAFEIAGLIGSVAAGIITDRYMSGKRAPLCVLYMLGATVSVVCFWKMPNVSVFLDGFVLFAVGFLIYGPQFLVGVMTADIVTKRAAATAIGMTGFFGYLSSILSGFGLGWLVDNYGWDGGFMMLAIVCLIGAGFFAMCWNAGPPKE